jgi:hypothetical protein
MLVRLAIDGFQILALMDSRLRGNDTMLSEPLCRMKKRDVMPVEAAPN